MRFECSILLDGLTNRIRDSFMKATLCLTLIVVLIPSSYGQYRLVDGKIYPDNSPEWTVFDFPIQVVGLVGEARLRCRTFLVNGEVVGSAVVPGQKRFQKVVETAPLTANVKRYYGEPFIIANYPAARGFKVGDIILRQIRAMRMNGIYYDCGVPYIPPQRQLTPAEAAAAKEIASK